MTKGTEMQREATAARVDLVTVAAALGYALECGERDTLEACAWGTLAALRRGVSALEKLENELAEM